MPPNPAGYTPVLGLSFYQILMPFFSIYRSSIIQIIYGSTMSRSYTFNFHANIPRVNEEIKSSINPIHDIQQIVTK